MTLPLWHIDAVAGGGVHPIAMRSRSNASLRTLTGLSNAAKAVVAGDDQESAQGQIEGEGRAAANLTADPDPSAVEFDELSGDREPETGALDLLRRRPDLAELLEHLVL